MAMSAAAYMIMLCMNEYDCIISCSNSQIPLLRRKGKKNLFIIFFFVKKKKMIIVQCRTFSLVPFQTVFVGQENYIVLSNWHDKYLKKLLF